MDDIVYCSTVQRALNRWKSNRARLQTANVPLVVDQMGRLRVSIPLRVYSYCQRLRTSTTNSLLLATAMIAHLHTASERSRDRHYLFQSGNRCCAGHACSAVSGRRRSRLFLFTNASSRSAALIMLCDHTLNRTRHIIGQVQLSTPSLYESEESCANFLLFTLVAYA